MWIFPGMGIAVKNVHFSLVGKKKMLERPQWDFRWLLQMPMIITGCGR
jgi:hypothetical protein